MTHLEKTIIEQARYQLTVLRSALMQSESGERDDGITSAFWMLNGITLLANLANSGMSKATSQQLLAIDAEAAQAIAAARLVGIIPNNLSH